MTDFPNEAHAHLAKLATWKQNGRGLKILFNGAENPAMRTAFAVELEMVATLAGFNEQTLNAIFKGPNGTSLKLSFRDCRFEVVPGRVPLSTEEGLKIQFPGGEVCLVGVLPEPPIK